MINCLPRDTYMVTTSVTRYSIIYVFIQRECKESKQFGEFNKNAIYGRGFLEK